MTIIISPSYVLSVERRLCECAQVCETCCIPALCLVAPINVSWFYFRIKCVCLCVYHVVRRGASEADQ
jgi:hypothetical protein